MFQRKCVIIQPLYYKVSQTHLIFYTNNTQPNHQTHSTTCHHQKNPLQNNYKNTLSFYPQTKNVLIYNIIFHPIDKHTLILDLDQTLIHCNQSLQHPYDISLPIKFPTGQLISAGINIRPYINQLFQQLSSICQLIIFTASHQCYANVVINYIDPEKKYIKHRLYRNHCYQTNEGMYIKDLRVIKGRNIENMLLVDNAAYSYANQLENGVPIVPYYQGKQDQELNYLLKYVKMLIKMLEDSQKNSTAKNQAITLKRLNQNYFKLKQYTQFKDLQSLTKKLYENTIQQYQSPHF